MEERKHIDIELGLLRELYNEVKEYSCTSSSSRGLNETRNALRDSVVCAEILCELHRQAAKKSFEALASLESEEPSSQAPQGDRTIDWLERYATQGKALFYFVRSLQDAVYRLLLEANGQQVSDNSRISKILVDKRGDNPMSKMLKQSVPEFLEWFKDFREKRNYIKRGTPIGAGASASRGHFSASIIFLKAKEDNVSVDREYFAKTLHVTRLLVQSVIEQATTKGFILNQ